MNLFDVIKTRRSIRKYKKKDVSDEIIRKLIDTTRYTPSSRDSQPWEFIIIKNKETKRQLAEIKGKENEEILSKAPVTIAICVDTNKSPSRWIEDGACAAMNILLMAHNLGLGAVYVTGYSQTTPEITPILQGILSLPKHVMPVCLIAIGYPDEMPEPKELRNLEEIIHKEKY